MKKIATKRRKKITDNQTLLVTLDIGKYQHYCYFRCPDGTEVKPFAVSVNQAGFNQLWQQIQTLQRTKGLSQVVLGIESTGVYGLPVLHYFKEKGVTLVQTNPKHTRKAKEIEDNSPGKTDQKDPRVIANVIELGGWMRVVIPRGVANDVRQLIQLREDCKGKQIVLKNQVGDRLYQIFPEFEQVMTDLDGKTARYLLARFPTPQLIVALGPEKLTQVMRQKSHGRLSVARSEALYQAAATSVGITTGRRYQKNAIQQLLQQIEAADELLAQYERELGDLLQQVPASEWIMSIKGVGLITTATLIGELADFRDFRSAAEVEKYAGLNLYEISSGRRKGEKGIAKRGRPLLRKVLFFAALNVVKEGGIYHAKYQRYLDQGKPKLKALVAIMRKLLRLIFSLVQQQKHFDLKYFEQQQLLAAA
ncbi:IS110 family transposase [candidate division KSB1 bacterium]|nr:IS110 family transposase [candidate division KSB1 bacterium]